MEDWNKIIKDEVAWFGRFLYTLKWARDFIDTEEGKKIIEMIENEDNVGAQKLILETLLKKEKK